MSFKENCIEDFLENFHKNKKFIRKFNGCRLLELYRDKNDTNVFFTYSYWNSEEDLQNYRNSDLFKNVWSITKTLFSDRPKAWSVDKIVSLY
jgi:heme-degrading monooxygenase HmoA